MIRDCIRYLSHGLSAIYWACFNTYVKVVQRLQTNAGAWGLLEVYPVRVIDVRATLSSSHGGIHFLRPSNWDFHVISHTWSLDIREFSKLIGQQIQPSLFSTPYNHRFQRAHLSGQPAYEGLLEFLQLLADDGVVLVWFDALCINQHDDAEKSREIGYMGAYYGRSNGCYALVHGIGQGYSLWPETDPGLLPRWFNRVWTLQELALPRSMLVVTELPERVQIIARGLIRERMVDNHLAGFCRCCIWRDVLDDKVSAEQLEKLRLSPPSTSANSNSVIDISGQSAFVCTKCGSSSLIRRADRRTMSGRTIYMVGREAHLFLLFLDSTLNFQPTYEFRDDILMDSIRISKLIKSIEEGFDPWMIWPEIASRQCSHDEDRVLGILGLLGFRGDMQLRTGQTLEQQLAQVANSCDPDVLIKVCTVDPRGGPAPGLSWAPNFRDPYAYFGVSGCGLHARSARRCFGHEPFHNVDSEGSFQLLCCPQLKPGKDTLQLVLDLRHVEMSLANLDERIKNMGDFERRVEIVKVTENGMILKGKAVVGGVKPCGKDGSTGKMVGGLDSLSVGDENYTYEEVSGWRNAGGAVELPREHSPTHCLHFQDAGVILPVIWSLNSQWKTLGRRDAEHFASYFPELTMALASHPWNPIYLQLPHNQAALEALPWPVLHRLEDKAIQIEMELWAVLLGSVANGSYHVAMMCMAMPNTSKDSKFVQLHKVGTFLLPIQVSDQIFSHHLPTTCFEIGGFGPDLSEFVTFRIHELV